MDWVGCSHGKNPGDSPIRAVPIEALADGSPPGPSPRPAYAMAQWVLPSQDEQLGLPNGRSSARGSSRTQMESWEIPSPAIAMVIIGGYTWSKMLNWDLTSRICSVYQFSSTCGSNPNILYEYMPKATSGQDQVHLSCTVRYIWDVHKIKNHMVNAQPVPLQM